MTVVLRLAHVELVFVLEADDEFVNQWHAEARHLHHIAVEDKFCQRNVGDEARLWQARRTPYADDRVSRRGQAGDWHFHRDGGDVFIKQGIGGTGAAADDACRRDVHQIKHLTQIDAKAFTALADEYFARCCTTGNIDVVKMPGCIRRIVGDRLETDIVDGFVEFGCATGDGRELPCTVAGLTALTTDQIH